MKAVKNSHKPAHVSAVALIALALCNNVAAEHTAHSDKLFNLDLSAGFGLSTGDLQWSIASDLSGSETPNVLSELTFSDIERNEFITHGALKFRRGFLKNIVLEGHYVSGEATDGTTQDSDYSGDNRTGEYSRSLSDASGSETTQFEFTLGYEFKLSESWSVTPKFAYAYNEQHLTMTDGVQVLDTRVMALSLGPFDNDLNSSYTAEWEGVWFGGDLNWQQGNHRISLGLQMHFQDYYAEANWNLREDFEHPVSFAHWAEAEGTRWKAKYTYHFAKHFSAWVEASMEEFEADPGRDVVYFANGTKGATRLNGVTWESSGYAMGVEFNY